jgi:hypothetical protein
MEPFSPDYIGALLFFLMKNDPSVARTLTVSDLPAADCGISEFQYKTIVLLNRQDRPILEHFRRKHRGKP